MYRCTFSMGAAVLAAALASGGCGGSSSPAVQEPDHRQDIGDRDRERRSAFPDDDDDDDVDDSLEVEGLRGRMDPQAVQRGLEPHAQSLSDCFTDNVARKGFIGGKVVLKYMVTRDGQVKTVQVAESDIGAWPIESCLLQVARAMSFASPKGGEADFTVPLDFGATRPVQWWTAEKSEAAVDDHLQELAACGEEAGASPRDVWVTAYVGPRGRVQSVGFASAAETPVADEWADCAAEIIAGWKLPDPRGQIAKLGFRYPE